MFKELRKQDITRSVVALLLFCLFHHQLLAVATAYPSDVVESDVSAPQHNDTSGAFSHTNMTISSLARESHNLTSMAPEYLTLTEITDSLSTYAELNKPMELTLLGVCLVAGGVGAAMGGASYTLGHLLWGDPWDWYDFASACVTGAALMIASILLNIFGPSTLAYVFDRTTEAGVAMAIEPIVADFFRDAVSGITSAWDAMFSNINSAVENNSSQWESTFGPTIQSLVDASGGQHGQAEFDSRWADFTNSTVVVNGMSISGAGVEFNQYYGASWRFLYPGSSYMTFSFEFQSAPENAVLNIIHLSSANESCQGGGYSPIDIFINGYLIADNYDVAENNSGSHGYETERWDLAGKLLTHNTLRIELEDDPWACTHYWIQNLAILPGTLSGDNTPPTVVGCSWTSATSTNINATFSEDMDQLSMTNSSISVEGETSGSHSCGFAFNRSTFVLTIDPSVNFAYNEQVTVSIGTSVSDLSGAHLQGPYIFSFQSENEDVDPTDIVVTAFALSPATVDPYGAFQVTGSAEYNNGHDVSVGTAVISVQGGSTYTAAVSNGTFSRLCQAPGNSSTSNISRQVTVVVSDGTTSSGQDSANLTIRGQGGVSYDLTTDIVYDWEGDNTYVQWWPKDAFRSTDDAAELLALFENVNVDHDLDLMWRCFYPNGTQYGSDLIKDNAIPSSWDWGWHVWGWLIRGNSMAYNPGKYRQEFFVDGSRKATHYYVVAWDFTQHFLCKDYDGEWQPLSQTNVFRPDDARAIALHHFEYRAQGLDVKTEFYSPNGFYDSSSYSFADDLGPQEWYGWSRHARWIWINGYAPRYLCGNWTVKFYVKNPSSAVWEQKYTDYFRIEESISPSVSISHQPANPIETQNVTINVSATDNNHLHRAVLHWNDGSDHSRELANAINSTSFNDNELIGSFSGDIAINYWVEAWDESGNRAESEHKAFLVRPETVTEPSRPAGPVCLTIGDLEQYSTGGAMTSLGNLVQYQFDWGDGTTSSWNGTTASKAWSTDGTHLVRGRARSQVNTERVSTWSTSLPVIVDTRPPNVTISTNGGADTTVTDSLITIAGQTLDNEPSSGIDSTRINSGAPNNGDATTWSFNVLLDDGENQLIVTSRDNSGNEGRDTIVVTYDPCGALIAPTNCQVTDSLCNEIRITWSWSGSDPDGFRVYRAGESKEVCDVIGSVRQCLEIITGAYAYYVEAYKRCGAVSQSSIAEGLGKTAPTPPTTFWAYNGCNSITYGWGAVSGADGYCVYINGDSVWSGTETSHQFNDLEPIIQMFTVATYNECGPGEQSTGLGKTPLAIPNTPSWCSATNDRCGFISISWENVDMDGGYIIYRDRGVEPNDTTGHDITSYVDSVTGQHEYSVTAFNYTCGESEKSEIAIGTGRTVSSAVQPKMTPLVNKIKIDWPAASLASIYELKVIVPTLLDDTIITASETGYSFDLPTDSADLAQSGLYWVELTCLNDCGRSNTLADSIELYHIGGQVVDREQSDTLRSVWVYIGFGGANALNSPEVDSTLTNRDGHYRFVVAPGLFEVWRDSIDGDTYSIDVIDAPVDGKNFDVVTDVREIESPDLPNSYSLNQNYPNPFNPTTQIEFEIPTASFVEIHIYNIMGERLRTLVSERLSAGRKVVTWDGKDDLGRAVSSGVYFYRIVADGYAEAKKMVLLK